MLQIKADEFGTAALYESAQESCRNAKETWALLQESARVRAGDPQAWELEQQGWQAFRAAAGCERTAWEFLQEDLGAVREKARTAALSEHGAFERTVEERTRRAIDRGRGPRPTVMAEAQPVPAAREPVAATAASGASDTIPTFEAAWEIPEPKAEAQPVPAVREPDAAATPSGAWDAIPTFEAAWEVPEPRAEALVPAAAPEVPMTVPSASSDMVARIRSLLEEEAATAMPVTSLG